MENQGQAVLRRDIGRFIILKCPSSPMTKRIVRGGAYTKEELEKVFKYVGPFGKNLEVYRPSELPNVHVFVQKGQGCEEMRVHLIAESRDDGKIQFYAAFNPETGKPELPSYV